MTAERFQQVLRVITDFEMEGLAYRRGTCPSCGKRVVSAENINGNIELVCSECSKSAFQDAVRRAIIALNGNGKHAPEDTVSSESENKVVSVVSVVGVRAGNMPPAELEPEALYGLPGEVVLTIEPHTESHPAAILASFLTGGGCLLGRQAYVYRDGARHYPNEFANLVGRTAGGRKGTASRRVDEVFNCLFDSNSTKFLAHDMHARGSPYADLMLPGLGSGEALIEALADEDEDRRRLVFEEEFSKCLKVMRREGSTLSETLRSAWDGGILANRTKGKKLIAKDTHVCVLGHITEKELQAQLGSVDMFNGFANRFLWFYTRRSRSLPFGGGKPPIANLVRRLHEALVFSNELGQMEFDEETKRVWAEGGIYDLLTDRPPGLLGAVTSRAEAHVTRLALIYAVFDLDREIRLPHLLAALAVWDYNERTCAYLFGTSTGDEVADVIEELLQEVHPGYLTRTQMRDHFQKNAAAGRIPKALELLQDQGRAEMTKLPGEGRGRKVEAWTAIVRNPNDRNDKNDLIPLRRARQLVREWGLGGT